MTKTIGILGCGLVGSYVGLHLQNLPEIKVYFIGRRDSWREELRSSTVTTSSCSAASAPTSVQGSKLNIVLSLDEIAEKLDFLIVSVKRTACAQVALQIGKSIASPAGCCKDTCIVTLMNGVNASVQIKDFLLETTAGSASFVEGMWSTNVVRQSPSNDLVNYHMGTSGFCYLEESKKGSELAALFSKSGLETKNHPDMSGVQYGKILMNLNNAINALSGMPLKEELADPDYRSLFASCMREALMVYESQGINPVSLTPLPVSYAPLLMAGLPNFIFVLLMPLLVKVDEKATSSMFEDLKNKRDTEIEYLQGEVCRLAEKAGIKVPCNAAVRELIQKRQSLKEGVVSFRPSEIYSIPI